MGYIYVLTTILLTVYGQLVIKWRVSTFPPLPEALSAKVFFLLGTLFDPFVMSGFIAAFFAALCWIAAMTQLNISQAYPILVCALLIGVTLGGIIFFGERLSSVQTLGIVLLLAGLGLFVVK